jgi:hypothetical protein
MKNQVLDDIKKYAAQRLQREYGFCGLADGPNSAFLNSSSDLDGIDITIEIKATAQVVEASATNSN